MEFSRTNVPREEMTANLEAVILLINQTLEGITPEQPESENPAFFDQPPTMMNYVLVQLLVHLKYHSGQVNYRGGCWIANSF